VKRAPVPIAGAVERLAASLEPQTTLGGVQREWEAVVGPAVARHARPVAERGGTVTVECDSATWAQELDLLAPRFVAALDEALGGGRVRALRCTAAKRRKRR
jgi:predicted nucleic acid-binding Zn ribbon protein